ncbi:MAG: RagB/SusD family nutrient uptake outer membrane protein, partial [Candidatus Lokiarchaeota archaeon]
MIIIVNAILIIIDTLRQDHVGAYGNPWIKTPNLDSFAKESVKFTRMYPESLPTLPARKAIYTGKRVFPFNDDKKEVTRTGRGDFIGNALGAPGWSSISDSQDTLAERFGRKKYTSVLFSDVYHQFKPGYNFARGFNQWKWIRGQEDDAFLSGPRISDEVLDDYLTSNQDGVNAGSVFAQHMMRRFLQNVHWFRSEADTLERVGMAVIAREEDRDRWIAEAHILRAYFYMELLKWYGPVPIEKEPFELDYEFSVLSRPDFEECARFIVDDCETALQSENLPWRLTTLNERNRMTKGIAMAIRSEASLFAASSYNNGGTDLWNWAYTINKDCLEQLKAKGFELYTQCQDTEKYYGNAYMEYFTLNNYIGTDPSDKETIWQSTEGYWPDPYTNPLYDIIGAPVLGNSPLTIVPSQELVDAYDMLATGKPVLDLANPYTDETHLNPNYNENTGYDPENPYEGRDPRFYATVFYNRSPVLLGQTPSTVETFVGGNSEIRSSGKTNTRTGYYWRKRMVNGNCKAAGVAGYDGRFRFYRLGKIYLSAAEAAIESGNIPEGLDWINEIRHRAGFSSSVDLATTDKEEARLLVRHERQVELACEE